MTLIWTGHHDDEMMGCADLVFHISGGDHWVAELTKQSPCLQKLVSSLEPYARKAFSCRDQAPALHGTFHLCVCCKISGELLVSLVHPERHYLMEVSKGPAWVYPVKHGCLPGKFSSSQDFTFSGSVLIYGPFLIRHGCSVVSLFLPGVIFIRPLRKTESWRAYVNIMPDRVAFVLAVSLRFIPMMIEEVRSIYEAQVYRELEYCPGIF